MSSQWQAVAKWSVIGLCVVAGMAAPVYAGDDNGRERGFGGPDGMMAKAAEACEGKSAGDTVSLSGRNGAAVEAVCTQRPATLVAIPTAMLERMAAAKAACTGLTEGASAVLSTPDGRNLAATCQSRDGELIAVPTERPRKRS